MAFNKYKKLKKQWSYNGAIWADVDPPEYKQGELIEVNSKDCGYLETMERWIPVPNEYICDESYIKWEKLKKQISYDSGEHWEDFYPPEYKQGSLIEENSIDCGYGITWELVDGYICHQIEDLLTKEVEVPNEYICDDNYNLCYKMQVVYSLDEGKTWLAFNPPMYVPGDVYQTQSTECGYTMYEWQPVKGEYICLSENKYEKLQYMYSEDKGVSWLPVEPNEFKRGEIIEEQSLDCAIPRYRWFKTEETVCVGIELYSIEVYQVSKDFGKTWQNVEPEMRRRGSLISQFSEECGAVPWLFKTDGEKFTSGDIIFRPYGLYEEGVYKYEPYVYPNIKEPKLVIDENYKSKLVRIGTIKGQWNNNTTFGGNELVDISELFTPYDEIKYTLNEGMFKNSTQLTSIDFLPFNLYSNGEDVNEAFMNCTSLDSAESIIKEFTFENVDQNKTMDYDYIFYNTALENINIEDDTTLFSHLCNGRYAFANCTSLVNFKMNDFLGFTNGLGICHLTSMFEGDNSLRNVEMQLCSDGSKYVKVYTFNKLFKDCTSLENVIMKGWDMYYQDGVCDGAPVDMWLNTPKLKMIDMSNLKCAHERWDATKVIGNTENLIMDNFKIVDTYDYPRSNPNTTYAQILTLTGVSADNIRMNDLDISYQGTLVGDSKLINVFKNIPQVKSISFTIKDTDESYYNICKYFTDFSGDVNLETISGLNTIKNNDELTFNFNGCEKLTSFDLPDLSTVTKVSYDLGNCKLMDNTVISSLLNASNTYDILAVNGTQIVDATPIYDLKFGTTKTYGDGFYKDCTSLTTVKMLSKQISNSMFENCTSLVSPSIVNNGYYETAIMDVFKNCTSLQTVNGELYIGKGSFSNCTSLQTVDISAIDTNDIVFDNCNNLTRVTCTSSTTTKSNKPIFNNCPILNEVNFGKITSLSTTSSSRLFSNCPNVTDITISSIYTNPRYVFNDSNIKNITINTIYNASFTSTFAENNILENFTVNSLYTSSGSSFSFDYTFKNCISLKEVTFGNTDNVGGSVTLTNTFLGCTSLKTINIKSGSKITRTKIENVLTQSGIPLEQVTINEV